MSGKHNPYQLDYSKGSMMLEHDDTLEGMHVLDARENEFGETIDTYMFAILDKFEKQDRLLGSAVVDLSNNEAA
jgi:hypothetical protein